jgi:gluconolactonase
MTPPEWQPSARYPDPAVVAEDESFNRYRLPLAKVERLAAGLTRWAEGPVWFGDQRCLIWSDVPGNCMWRWDEETGAASVFRKPSGHANGNTRDRQGRLLSCEHGGRRVSRTEPDGRVVTLVSHFENKKLNSPNDIVCKSDGSVWFTDPTFGILGWYEGAKAEPELPMNVYRWDSSGKVTVVAEGINQPNGLAFSPDEKLLYVADSGKPHHVRRFRVKADNTLEGGEVFTVITPGVPDGMRTDRDGRLWSTAGDGVHVFSPDGKLIGRIKTPKTAANCAFGGPDKKTLFITASSEVWAVKVMVAGAR